MSLSARLTFLGSLLVALFFGSFLLGRYPVPPQDVVSLLLESLGGSSAAVDDTMRTVVVHVRLPRILGAILVGGALSVSGAAYQNLFKNPLVSPGILGVSAGASGLLALHKGSFIAFVCATSWTLIACAMLVPYLGLLAFGPRWGRARVWGASAGGFLGATAWYLAGYGPTAGKLTGLVAPGLLGSLHPLAVGLLCSLGGVLLGGRLKMFPARESLGGD